MFLVDSHCHLDRLNLLAHEGLLTNALVAARQHDIKHFLCVCITLADFPAVLDIAVQHLGVSASVGLHPTEQVVSEPSEQCLIDLAGHEKIVALGETGLDYYRCTGDVRWQQERFRRHIRAAVCVGKPLIVHTRQARADTLTILREEGAHRVGGVLHCFSEDWDMAAAALDLNFYISFSGIITFPNTHVLRDVAKRLPLTRLLLETDAPYLTPHPHRGKPNEPAYVKYVAQAVAELRGITLAALAKATTDNFFNLFTQAQPYV